MWKLNFLNTAERFNQKSCFLFHKKIRKYALYEVNLLIKVQEESHA